jgi:uncharacterized protein YdiU (UPF0061 family)
MPKPNSPHSTFPLNNSYLSLPDAFYSKLNPTPVKQPEWVLLNEALLEALELSSYSKDELLGMLSGSELPEGSTPFAQAYAGHQFGGFTMLGDGRAILLGEQLTSTGERFDIQLKGSGRTPYSRRGDGRATLKSMLREYLMSEAMYYLGIPSSRSLAVVKTGEPVYRESVQEGAVLTRVMQSHIRVGTFEYAWYFGTESDLESLLDYTIDRHFPALKTSENPALAFLEEVMRRQVSLVVEWMRVGFIHGVMNTDNTSISGETFDYGPCAFMNVYHPGTVFSSIDTGGRYAFGKQPGIIKWNMVKLAETLLPLIDPVEDQAVDKAIEVIKQFDFHFTHQWYAMMFGKIGLEAPTVADRALVDELLALMQASELDYTHTFLHLSQQLPADVSFARQSLEAWQEKWLKRITEQPGGPEAARALMKQHNPVLIPRNMHVEQVLDRAAYGDMGLFHKLLSALKSPYEYQEAHRVFLDFDPSYDDAYQTFCGT